MLRDKILMCYLNNSYVRMARYSIDNKLSDGASNLFCAWHRYMYAYVKRNIYIYICKCMCVDRHTKCNNIVQTSNKQQDNND